MNEMTNINDLIDWEIIVQTIKEDKCILFLGPEVYTDESGNTLEQQIMSFLELENDKDIQNYYSKDGLFLFHSEEGKTRLYYRLKRFFDQSFPKAQAILEKIVDIPFQFIVVLTPDNLLEKTFLEKQFNCKTDFYWKNRTPSTSVNLPSKHRPLIYNMFGSIKERDSLILTHEDLFDYFNSILGARSMPDELKNLISQTDNFLFLGIRFDRWYMQLLLRVLAKYNAQNNFLRYASSLKISPDIISFCMEQFRITFVDLEIEDIVEKLHKECETRHLLREPEEENTSELTRIRALIAKARTDEAITRFNQLLTDAGEPAEELLDQLILNTERLNRLNRKINNATITESDAEVKYNQITQRILALVNEAKPFE